MKTLGIDIGSSSVKVSLLDVDTGRCAGSVTLPPTEMPIDAPRPGWAEQDPQMWWDYVCQGIRTLAGQHPMKEIAAVGIIVTILNQVLVRSGREEQATMTTLAGLVVVLMIVAQKIAQLFDLVQSLFRF